MRRWAAAAGSAAYFAAAAGTAAVLVPWLVTGWKFGGAGPGWVVARAVGVVLIGVGVVPVVSVFVQFTRAGGTPLPLAPPRRLVVSGFNRYVRNPVYVGSLLIFAGQALLFWSLRLLLYTVAGWSGAAVFVRCHEEPALARRFGAEYAAYRRAVPAWRPRLHPWRPAGGDGGDGGPG